ncbi:MAG TPA: hypothetical protein VNO32_42425, partial [Candidatus Acidoferrum sp.]|nr:hypothetical protein [Candidatus Acidoferrum sp.]
MPKFSFRKGHTMLFRFSYLKITAAILACTAGCLLPSPAQQPDQKRVQDRAPISQRQQPGQSELENENLNLVAAAPALIKEVLIKDPGLLVELKRWIAKEASSNGQIVSGDDLTDTAVFDRLTTDIKFRSIATRLVQRYGYLRPSFNPDSELGKEQDLLLKERVRRQVQIEAQEDAENLNPKKPETRETKTEPCELDETQDCPQETPSRPRRTTSPPEDNFPQKDLLPNYQNDGQPLGTSPRIMQAAGGADGIPFSASGTGLDSLLNVSGPMKLPGDSR